MTKETDPMPVRSISPHNHTFPALDGLRGLAVVLVLLIHTAQEMQEQLASRAGVAPLLDTLAPLTVMGGTGVHLFFVLSGFLLFMPFARGAILGQPRPATLPFLKRRALRIIPAYYAITTLAVVLFEREAVQEAPFKQVVSHLFLVHNFSAETIRGLNGPTWTMAVESQFYVMLPLLGIAAAAAWQRGRALLLSATGLLLLASPAASVAGALLRRTGIDSTFLTAVAFLSVFAAGMMASWAWVLAESGRLTGFSGCVLGRAGGALFLLIFIGLMVRRLVEVGMPTLDYYGYAMLMGTCYLGLLLHVLFRGKGVAARTLSRPVPRFLGDISYSLYLVHYPLIQHVVMPLAGQVPDPFAIPAAIFGTVLLLIPVATTSFWCIERPFLNRKQHPAATKPMPAAQFRT